MKTLYIDCGMGAAGDMLSAALLELFEDKENVMKRLNAIGIPSVTYTYETVAKCGIMGTQIHVLVDGVEEGEHAHGEHIHGEHIHGEHVHGEHVHGDHENEEYVHGEHAHEEHVHGEQAHEKHVHGEQAHEEHARGEHVHTSMTDVTRIIQSLNASAFVKEHAVAVYRLIAEAEGHAHGKTVNEIHFHEVGTMDAIADVVAVCYLLEQLAPERIIASSIHVGSGHVHCAHGVLPVPAPATAFLLKGVPMYGGEIKSELCTPTGAALLKHFVQLFGDMPVITAKAVGYGMGKKDFEKANCVRVILGETEETEGTEDFVVELTCNLDDMTPEAIGFAMDILLESGALDVFTTAIGMKKNRPGVTLSVLSKSEDEANMRDLIFKHTTTIGIRVEKCKRYTLRRKIVTEQTKYGPVRKKITSGYDVTREKYEYEDLAKIAKENQVSIQELQL